MPATTRLLTVRALGRSVRSAEIPSLNWAAPIRVKVAPTTLRPVVARLFPLPSMER